MIDQTLSSLNYVEHLSYLGIFFSVAFSGYIIPIPEEIILILGGYLVAQGISNGYVLVTLSVLGALFGDTLIYYLSSQGSHWVEKYRDRVERSHAGWYMRNMRKHPMRTIFFSRFIIGMRFLNPLVSGLMRIHWKKFMLATFLSALIYIPCIIFLGYYFSHEIQNVLFIAHSVRRIIINILMVLTGILCILFFHHFVEKRR